MSDTECLIAAQTLISQRSQQNDPSAADDASIHSREEALAASLSHSLSSLDRFYNESIAIGARVDGRMSAVRRFFCLFVLFDLLLTSFAWLTILVLTEQESLITKLGEEILHYGIKHSLFDVVMVSLLRFVVVMLFYGILKSNSRFYVALTTFGTCLFLIGKVMYYDWKGPGKTAIEVPFLFATFILTWSEVWFVDFRVLPQEQQATEYLLSRDQAATAAVDTKAMLKILLGRGRIIQDSEPASSFHSVPDSPNDSDEESSPEVRRWEGLAQSAVTQSVSLINDLKWKLERQADNAAVFSKDMGKTEKCLKLVTTCDIDKATLHRELYDEIASSPTWNPVLSSCVRLRKLRTKQDIIYQVTSKTFMMKPRDFVLVRKSVDTYPYLVIAAISIDYPLKPPVKEYTRADSGACCWALRALPTNANMTEVTMMMNANLKLPFPNSMIKNASIDSMLSIIKGLHDHVKGINERRINTV